MCIVWPCHSFVEGLSQKCINAYEKENEVRLINYDCLPILVLLYIMLAYLMLFVCIMLLFLPLIFANAFCFHSLSWFIDT